MKLGALAQIASLAALLAWSVPCLALETATVTSSSSTQAPSADTYDIASFSNELRHLDVALDGDLSQKDFADLQRSLPSVWQVVTPERTYPISTSPLRVLLRKDKTGTAQAWLENLRAAVDSYAGAPPSYGDSQERLKKILSDPRFGAVRPPGAWELMRQRIVAWLERMLGKLFGGIARHPLGAEILFWILLVAGVGFVAMLVYRFFIRRDAMNELKPSASPITLRSWQEWVRSAREAAARGDYREAIHCAYWAGITRLQDAGALPRDRAKTPREYLRALAAPRDEAANFHEKFKEPLGKLTNQFERAWYANRGARSEDFTDTLHQLEALGCPLD
jgi:hypothetical protein